VKIAWYLGNTRSTRFDVLTSTDGSTWTTVVSGANSSGTTTAFETYGFSAVTARYVHYVCNGTSIDRGNAIAETRVIGQQQPAVRAPPSPGPGAIPPFDTCSPLLAILAPATPVFGYWGIGEGPVGWPLPFPSGCQVRAKPQTFSEPTAL